eukprot:TRINITY_DN29415_c0_g1_i2.p1 TRINITY_DN29415_c0_g1~~TRINITY_DN29415_c0_g1_i2.p1  ORF type:complete len:100 (+),score=5.34 TRINITY_DN29415_c0_g1_i2:86-385(+)
MQYLTCYKHVKQHTDSFHLQYWLALYQTIELWVLIASEMLYRCEECLKCWHTCHPMINNYHYAHGGRAHNTKNEITQIPKRMVATQRQNFAKVRQKPSI